MTALTLTALESRLNKGLSRVSWPIFTAMTTGILIILLIILLSVIFTRDIFHHHADEAGAVGAILGGALGACGAGFAVYLSLQAQRREDRRRTEAAILGEIVELNRFAIVQFNRCKLIRIRDKVDISYRNLRDSMKPPEPVIFPMVADRIGLLDNSLRLVKFYGKLRDIPLLIKDMSLSNRDQESADMTDIHQIAKLWMRICQRAQKLIENDVDSRAGISRQRERLLKQNAKVKADWDAYFKSSPAPQSHPTDAGGAVPDNLEHTALSSPAGRLATAIPDLGRVAELVEIGVVRSPAGSS